MKGETRLDKLINEMDPELHTGEYVFCSLDPWDYPADLNPLGLFHEKEGITVILPKAQADELGFNYSFIGAWITLNVQSSLQAVGLTAAVSRALADAGIACNVVAGFHHDHIFVPRKQADRALGILQNLAHRK
jgi:hypothetical protein